jgi:hypothetical protein
MFQAIYYGIAFISLLGHDLLDKYGGFEFLMQVGPIAQSVEQRTFNPWVDGSSPSGPTFTLPFPRLRHA